MASGESNLRLAEEVPRLLREVTEVCVPVFERRLSKIVCGTLDGLLVGFEWSSMREAPVLDQYNALNLLAADGGASVLGGLEHFMCRLRDSCDLNLGELFLEVQVVALPPSATLHQKKIEYLPDTQLLRYSLPLHMGRPAICNSAQFERLALQIGETEGREVVRIDGLDETDLEEDHPAGPPNSRHSSRPCAISDEEADSDDEEIAPEISEWRSSSEDIPVTGPAEEVSVTQMTEPTEHTENMLSSPASPMHGKTPSGSTRPASERTPLVMNSNTKLDTSAPQERSCCVVL